MKDVQQKTCSAGVQTVFTMLLKRSQFWLRILQAIKSQ